MIKNKKLIVLLMTLLVALFVIFQQPKIESAVVDNVITRIDIQNSQGEPLTQGVGSWENFRLNAEFAFNNGQVQPGDTATIQLPEEVIFVGKSFEIRDVNGQVVANATIDSTSKQAVLTFTNYVTQRASFSGNFTMTVRIDHNVARTAQQIPLTVTVNHTPMYSGVVNYTGIAGMEPQDFAKSGWQDPNDNSKLHYIIYVNQNYLNFTDIMIGDTIQYENAKIDKSSFRVMSGTWYTDTTDNSIRLGYQEDVTASYSPQFSADGKSFTLSLKAFNPNRGYYVKYDVDLLGAPANGMLLNNNATMEDSTGWKSVADAQIVYQEDGGNARSNIFKVELTKKSDTGEKLQGAEFGLYYEGTLVKNAISDANGVVTFDSLIKPKYTIKETKAPAGYVLSEEEITVNVADAEGGVVRKEVVNKPETTTTTTTTTEAPTTTTTTITEAPTTTTESTTSSTTTTESTTESTTTEEPTSSSTTTETSTTEGATTETTVTPKESTTTSEADLPKTGTSTTIFTTIVGALSVLGGFAILMNRKDVDVNR